MITIYPYSKLGRANYEWLDARHHFSFANYYNPNRMKFGVLRVINDDIIKPQSGFDMHPHKNMEIITYVRSGAITHKDNKGNEGRIEAGDIQVMSAGSGIIHSEYNLEDNDTNLYQIWIKPNKINVEPRWDSKVFPKEVLTDSLPLLVSGNNDAPLFIYQDIEIYGGKLKKNTIISHPIKRQAYLLVSQGKISLEGQVIKRGDGVEITNLPHIKIQTIDDSEILILDVPDSSVN